MSAAPETAADAEIPVSRQDVLAQLRALTTAVNDQFRDMRARIDRVDDSVRGKDGLVALSIHIEQLRRDQATQKQAHADLEKDADDLRALIAKNEAAAADRWWKLLLALVGAGGIGGAAAKVLLGGGP